LTETLPASRVFPGLPPHAAGQAIGLYGGSFNPPHAGHRHVSLLALRRLGLAQVWWLVTPGNPLKQTRALPEQAERMQAAARVAAHPRIVISGVEAEFRTRYTADLIRILRNKAPAMRFVWIMGSDNLAQFHRWERWQDIAATVPIAVVNRPSFLAAPLSSRAAQALRAYRVDERDAATLPWRAPPAWTFLTGPRTVVSSTALREQDENPTRSG
jgi:nicotinate-nucleotide adenylyltransferase